ncbi:NAD(P)-binding protein [Halovenus sp. WSH3]|uniref:NAD(P)-binding protein n=1 Tax=Halovenus carboxidivorans TaxID=2692199 RepID=A0A6B0SYN6_9EURY|nr:FAD-dependent oxidoreductase [Halovenus carboxidivorans]MXR50888.1 NAD(P)-binding protein [Halovenus carboxidivorans]
MQIGVIGAGAASAAATHVLDQTVDAEITVLEKSGGLCGRAATRRRDGRYYDYGANYVKDDDERVVELLTETLDDEGMVAIDEPIYVFDEEGTVSEGRETERKWSYEDGLTQIAKRLFGGTDATIHRRTRVETIHRDGEQWRLTDADGERYGPFDVLLCNPPAPQTETLLREAEWDSEVRDALAEAAGDVEYRTIWTAVLGYESELDVPYYALVNTDKDHEIGWISREECKGGHVPDGESVLIVQANQEWSVEHYDDPAEENVAALAEMTADIIGEDRLRDPAWTDHQGWRYALPEESVANGPVDSAESEGLYCLGDWVVGEARLHAALRNGLDTGERIAYAVGGAD